jgi:hypothetical protein
LIAVPTRDWRGISYRALLPRHAEDRDPKAFNRFLQKESHKREGDDDNDSISSDSSDDSQQDYVPGVVDDPKMVLGRSKNVMIGDRVIGPIVSSTIQFVDPALLKADLNKQFRERFDGWEPPKGARKYIGARVIQGNYVLMDPAEEFTEEGVPMSRRHARQGSVTSLGSIGEGPKEKLIRMPPSLTLSKIRSLKHQALQAVKTELEISTLALACVYFERLCLDCRVDKSNRRLTFAVCLLLATKLNEPSCTLVIDQPPEKDGTPTRLIPSLTGRPNSKGSNSMFASLLEFFTQEWSLSLKRIFDAEWGVFAALGFSLHAAPSQVAFHFKRFMKTLNWNARNYLGDEMYNNWQDALEKEHRVKNHRERKRDLQRQRKEEQLLHLRIELERRKADEKEEAKDEEEEVEVEEAKTPPTTPPENKSIPKKGERLGIFHRFAARRTTSQDSLFIGRQRTMSPFPHPRNRNAPSSSSEENSLFLPRSPSLPELPAAAGVTLAHLHHLQQPDVDAQHQQTDVVAIHKPPQPDVVAIQVPEEEVDKLSELGPFEETENDGLTV